MRQKTILQHQIPIRINFDGAASEKFEVVKNYLGLKQNTEVVRALLPEKYNEIKVREEQQRRQRIREAEALQWLETGEYKCPCNGLQTRKRTNIAPRVKK